MVPIRLSNWIGIRIPDAGGYMPYMRNSSLNKAKLVKNDEFYTRYEDVFAECEHYDFTGLHVMCPFDDPEWSAFYKYFDDNYERLGLAGLTCTHRTLDGSPSYALVRDGGAPTRRVDIVRDVDFFTQEVNKLMQQCDVVVSNPPFSLWRKIFQNLMEWDMKFLLVGYITNPSYSNVIPEFMNGNIHLGFTHISEFIADSPSMPSNLYWYTNLPSLPHYRELPASKHYNPDDYPMILNCPMPVINVNKCVDIPVDYDGVMAVPISFIEYCDPSKFRLLGSQSYNQIGAPSSLYIDVDGVRTELFKRLLIQWIH